MGYVYVKIFLGTPVHLGASVDTRVTMIRTHQGTSLQRGATKSVYDMRQRPG